MQGKLLDGEERETYPYRFVLQDGRRSGITATIYATSYQAARRRIDTLATPDGWVWA